MVDFVIFATVLIALFVVPTHTALFAGRQIDLPLLDEQMMTAT